MSPPRPPSTRKEALFVAVIICVLTIFTIFVLAAAKIARELKAQIAVFWSILYVTALAIISLLYLTVLVAYYPPLSVHGSTSAINFILGVAWAIALVAEVVDPNNTFPSRQHRVAEEGRQGESKNNFQARLGLSGATSLLLLIMALAGSLKVLGIVGHARRRSPSPQEVELRETGGDAAAAPPSPPQRSSIMIVLSRVGIVKDRSTTTTNAVL